MKKILRILIKLGVGLTIVFVVLQVLYILNYYRLSISYPRFEFSISEFEKNTEHCPNKSCKGTEFKPNLVEINKPGLLIRVTDEIPYMGTHWINIIRYFDGFDPNRPDGIITWRGKIVAYQYYSDKPVGGYHWHKHEKMCGTENLVIKYGWSLGKCLKEGGIPQLPYMGKYMLHVWVVDNPAGINDAWNPNLDPEKGVIDGGG